MDLTNSANPTSMNDDDASPSTTTATRIGMGTSPAHSPTKDDTKKDTDPRQQQPQQSQKNNSTEIAEAKAQVELATVRAHAAKAQVQVAVAEAEAAQAKVKVAQRQEQEAQVLLEQAKAKLNALMPKQQAPTSCNIGDSSLEDPTTTAEAELLHGDPVSEKLTSQLPSKDPPIEGTKEVHSIEEADYQQNPGSISVPVHMPPPFHPPKQPPPNPTTTMMQTHSPPNQCMPFLHPPFVPTHYPFSNQRLMGQQHPQFQQQQQQHHKHQQQKLKQQQQEAMAIAQKYRLFGEENSKNNNKQQDSHDATASTNTSTTCTKTPPPPPPGTRTLIYHGPPNDDMSDVGGWPPGWTKKVFQRHDKRKDKYWYSPHGKFFNSLVKIRDFLQSEGSRKRLSVPQHHQQQVQQWQQHQQQQQVSQSQPPKYSQPIPQQQQLKPSLQNLQQQSRHLKSNYDQQDQDTRQQPQHQPQQYQQQQEEGISIAAITDASQQPPQQPPQEAKTAAEDINACNTARQQQAQTTDDGSRQEPAAKEEKEITDGHEDSAQSQAKVDNKEDDHQVLNPPSRRDQHQDESMEQSQSQSRNDNGNLAGMSASITADLPMLTDGRQPHMTTLQADIHGDSDTALKQPTIAPMNPLEQTEQTLKESRKELSKESPQKSLEKPPGGPRNMSALPDTIIRAEQDKWGSRDMRLIEKIRDFLLERWTLGQAEVDIMYVVEAVGYAYFSGRLKKAIPFLVDRGLLEQPTSCSVKLTDEGFRSASKMKEHSGDGGDATAGTNSRQINSIQQEYLTVQGPGIDVDRTYEKKRELNSVHAFTAGDAGPNTCPILNWGKHAIQKRPKLHDQSLNIAGKRTQFKITEPAPMPNEVTSQSRADDTTTDVGRSLDIGHSTENHKHDTTKLVIANFIAKIQVFLYRIQEKENSKVSELHIIDGIGVKDRDYAMFTKALDALKDMGHVEGHCHDIRLTREGVQTIAALFRRRSTRAAKETKIKAVFASRAANGPPVPEETVSGSTLQESSSDIQPDVIKLPNENTAEDTNNPSPCNTMLPRYDIDSDDDQTSIDSDTEMARLINQNLTQHWTDKTDAISTNLEKQCLSKQEVLNFCQTLKIQEDQPTKTAITNIFDLLSDGECHSKQELLDVSGYSYSEVCQFQATIQLLEKKNIIQHTGKKCYQMTDQMFPCGRFNTAAAGNHEDDIEMISECI